MLQVLHPRTVITELAYALPGYISSTLNAREDTDQVALALDKVSRALAFGPGDTESRGGSGSSSPMRRPPAAAAVQLHRTAEPSQVPSAVAAGQATGDTAGAKSSQTSTAALLGEGSMTAEQLPSGSQRARHAEESPVNANAQQQAMSDLEKSPIRPAVVRPLLGMATPREDDNVISLSPNTAAAAVATARKAAGISSLFGPGSGLRQQAQSAQPQQQPAVVLGPAEMAIWAVEAALLRRSDSSQG